MKKIFFISSSGGHFKQLFKLESLMKNNHSYLILEDNKSISWILEQNYKVYFIPGSVKGRALGLYFNFFKIMMISIKLFIKVRPDIIISTGSNFVLPFFICSKLFSVKSIYILTYARIYSKSLGLKMFYFLADEFIVQWEDQIKNFPKAKFFGGIY